MLHGFMQDRKWYEDLGHIGLGLLPIDLLLWVREFTKARLPWPFKGQWPLGERMWVWFMVGGDIAIANYDPSPGWDQEDLDHSMEVTETRRVEDLARDQLGYAIGQQLRVCLLVGLLWWRW